MQRQEFPIEAFQKWSRCQGECELNEEQLKAAKWMWEYAETKRLRAHIPEELYERIRWAMDLEDNVQSRAAERLGMSTTTFNRRLKEMG